MCCPESTPRGIDVLMPANGIMDSSVHLGFGKQGDVDPVNLT